MSCSFSFSFPLILSLIMASSLFSSSVISTNHPSMDPPELETLFKIMETLSSDQNWRVTYSNPCLPGSSWPGIACKIVDNRFHVSRLDFGTQPNPTCKKTATFPSEIFQLPHLESIFISHCFTHTPTRISLHPSTRPSSLLQLSLRSNPTLIGTIPLQISSLNSLQILTLSQNKLTGPLPFAIFGLISLLHLDLSYNSLTGQIPFQLGNLRNLVGLDLSYNKLTGSIPFSTGQLGALQKLDMSSNSLSGTIPYTIQKLNSLNFLALSGNRLRGVFPNITGLQNLQYFIMDDNPMFVPLPVEFSKLKKLQELRLANSGYSGNIPAAYSELTNLTTLSLQNNRLSGEIPVELGNLSHIYHLNLSRNFLTGVVPFNSSFLTRLGRNLDLSGNPGLCLSPSLGRVNAAAGVGVCGDDNKSSSLIKPLHKSEAPDSISISVVMVFLTLIMYFKL